MKLIKIKTDQKGITMRNQTDADFALVGVSSNEYSLNLPANSDIPVLILPAVPETHELQINPSGPKPKGYICLNLNDTTGWRPGVEIGCDYYYPGILIAFPKKSESKFEVGRVYYYPGSHKSNKFVYKVTSISVNGSIEFDTVYAIEDNLGWAEKGSMIQKNSIPFYAPDFDLLKDKGYEIDCVTNELKHGDAYLHSSGETVMIKLHNAYLSPNKFNGYRYKLRKIKTEQEEEIDAIRKDVEEIKQRLEELS